MTQRIMGAPRTRSASVSQREACDMGSDQIAEDSMKVSDSSGSYRQNQARFSCLLRDEWEVAMFMRTLAQET